MKKGRHWKRKDIATARRLLKEGTKPHEIAVRMNASIGTVKRHLKGTHLAQGKPQVRTTKSYDKQLIEAALAIPVDSDTKLLIIQEIMRQ